MLSEQKKIEASDFDGNIEEYSLQIYAAAKEKQFRAFVNQLNGVLELVYTDSDIVIRDITKLIAMSERQFFRKMKNVLDMTPSEYLRKYRLEKAKILLVQGKLTKSVCFDVGFSSQSYFGKCFKALYGVPPSEYRKQFHP